MGTEVQRRLSWGEVEAEAHGLADRWEHDREHIVGVYGIPQGGAVPAVLVAHHLSLPLLEEPCADALVVDDICDSGRTLSRFAGFRRDALYRKPWAPGPMCPDATVVREWLCFPWERDGGQPTDAVVRLLEHMGENPHREGLRDTPARVLRALAEMTDGYHGNADELLATTFEADGCDEMVVVTGIPFTSLCEHHLLPFTGSATVGYIPDGRIVGLSKLARVVDLYAHRLQVQERMTTQIATAVERALSPIGTGTVVRARHSCMGCRGARKPEAVMVTSAMLGLLRTDPKARAEFLSLEQNGHG